MRCNKDGNIWEETLHPPRTITVKGSTFPCMIIISVETIKYLFGYILNFSKPNKALQVIAKYRQPVISVVGRNVYGVNMNCLWCNQEKMKYITYNGKTVDRQLYEDDYTYVLVPRESHVKHHLIVVLKKNEEQHRSGLMECNSDDLTHIGKTIYKLCSKLKELPYRYDRVYSGCFSDAGHVHYHLFPLNIDRDKGYKGCAISRLSEKECRSECNSFEKMTHKAKLERLREIESIVQELIDK